LLRGKPKLGIPVRNRCGDCFGEKKKKLGGVYSLTFRRRAAFWHRQLYGGKKEPSGSKAHPIKPRKPSAGSIVELGERRDGLAKKEAAAYRPK